MPSIRSADVPRQQLNVVPADRGVVERSRRAVAEHGVAQQMSQRRLERSQPVASAHALDATLRLVRIWLGEKGEIDGRLALFAANRDRHKLLVADRLSVHAESPRLKP